MSSIATAREFVSRTPEHELRRLLERMAVTDPNVVIHAVERMLAFDAAKVRRDGEWGES